MNKTNKIILGILVVVVVIAGIWYGVSKKPATQEKGPVKIGAILPLSGKNAFYGEQAQRAFALAIEDIKKEMPSFRFDIVYEDSKWETQEAVSAFNRLKNLNDIDVVITLSSDVSLAVAPLANQQKVLQMAITASTPQYTSLGDFTFRTTARAEQEDKALAQAIASKYQKVALLYNNNERGLGHRNALKQELDNLGIGIVVEETLAPQDNDFRTQLIKIKKENPDVVYLLTEAKNTGLALKQAKELQIEKPFFATRSTESEEVISIAGTAADGVIYTYSFNPFSKEPVIQNFTKRFQEQYGRMPDYIAAEAYDALRLVAKAANQCSADTNCMKENLLKTKDFPGACGALTFDENGDVFYDYALKTIKNGQFVPYEE